MSPGVHRVLVDSNIFYSRTLRDWLALIYLEGEQPPFEVFWSEDILAEVVYHLRRNHPDWDGARIVAVRDSLTATFEVGRVEDFAVAHDGGVRDPNDLHVHAAALACQADILLTANVKDFVATDAYDAMTPDDFFVLVDDSAPQCVSGAMQKQIAFWGRRRDEVDLPAGLAGAGCPLFAERVHRHLRELALRR